MDLSALFACDDVHVGSVFLIMLWSLFIHGLPSGTACLTRLLHPNFTGLPSVIRRFPRRRERHCSRRTVNSSGLATRRRSTLSFLQVPPPSSNPAVTTSFGWTVSRATSRPNAFGPNLKRGNLMSSSLKPKRPSSNSMGNGHANSRHVYRSVYL